MSHPPSSYCVTAPFCGSYMEDLNTIGKKILDEIVQINSPLLLLAGPGMGKTYALAYKIKYLVSNVAVEPHKISVITFTNEAAINMRRRISSKEDQNIYVEQHLQPDIICTMHKLGNRITKDNRTKLGLTSGFNVLSSGYLRKILMQDSAQIIGAKRKDADETIQCKQNGNCNDDGSLKCKICNEYSKLLRKFGYIDHDDQVLLACKVLKENSDILAKEQEKATFLLVDEYQDINYAQWELIKLLSGDKPKNLFVVGDDYQSIYGFRGGHPKYIKNFQKDYTPDGIVRHLTISRRCPENIFKGAFCMAQKYNGGYDGLLNEIKFTEDSNILIKICNFDHQNVEADFIARKIRDISPSYEILILVPSINYANPIKRALKKRYVDFTCAYDIENTDLFLIKVLLDWLKTPTDNFLLRHLIQEIIDRGVTDMPAKQTEFVGTEKSRTKREDGLRQISNFWNQIQERKTLYLKIKTLKDNPLFKELISILTDLRSIYEQDQIAIFIPKLIEKMKVWKDMSDFSQEINSAIEEIKGLTMAGGDCNVRILTLRKAKGLEADYVFIVGLENNILPRERVTDEHKAEDSRLLYVSMTRAKKELYLLHSKKRDMIITKVKTNGRSEFIDNIPTEYVEEFN